MYKQVLDFNGKDLVHGTMPWAAGDRFAVILFERWWEHAPYTASKICSIWRQRKLDAMRSVLDRHRWTSSKVGSIGSCQRGDVLQAEESLKIGKTMAELRLMRTRWHHQDHAFLA